MCFHISLIPPQLVQFWLKSDVSECHSEFLFVDFTWDDPTICTQLSSTPLIAGYVHTIS